MDLPYCVLNMDPLEDGRYLGFVRVTDIIPNSYYRDIGSVLFVDQNDRLRGFNDAFFARFQPGFQAPAEMLGRSCRDFLSPTPRTLQTDYFRGLRQSASGPFKAVFNLKTALPEAEQFPEKTLKNEYGNWIWENPGNDFQYLTFSSPVDCEKSDFMFEVSFHSTKGFFPIVILGTRKPGIRMPGCPGYTFGVDPGTGRLFLKKYGYTVALSAMAHPNRRVPFTYALRKTGKALLFHINGREFLRYYDFNFIHNTGARISLCLRKESAVTFSGGGLHAGETPAPAAAGPAVVELKTEAPACFTLNQFYNDSLSTNFPDIHGYILQNVTRFREDAQRFEKMYSYEKKRGEVLNALVDGFREHYDRFLGGSPAIAAVKDRKEAKDDYLIGAPETRPRAGGKRGAGAVTRENLTRALKKHAGNVKRTAAALGVGRLTVYYNLKKYGMDPDRFRK